MDDDKVEALARQQIQSRIDRAATRRRHGRQGRPRPQDEPRWRRIAD